LLNFRENENYFDIRVYSTTYAAANSVVYRIANVNHDAYEAIDSSRARGMGSKFLHLAVLGSAPVRRCEELPVNTGWHYCHWSFYYAAHPTFMKQHKWTAID
jgi:hypothetical protein